MPTAPRPLVAFQAVGKSTRLRLAFQLDQPTVGSIDFATDSVGMLISSYSLRLQSAEMLATVFMACWLEILAFWIFGSIGRRMVGSAAQVLRLLIVLSSAPFLAVRLRRVAERAEA